MQPLSWNGPELCPLEESLTLLKLALRAAQAGSWAWDMATGQTFWSDEFHQLVGTDPATCHPSYESWLQTIHPEDRQAAALRMRDALNGRREINNEYRIVRPSGSVRWVRSQGQTVYGPDDQPLRMIGVTFDITERRLTEEALLRREEELRIITNGLPALISYVDAEQRYRFNNPMYERWFGQRPEEISGRPIRQVIGEAAYAELRPHVESALAGQETRFEMWLDYQGVGPRYVEARYVPHVDSQGNVRGFFALINDITERRRSETNAQLQAEELTAIMEATPAAIWIAHDPDCLKITGNRAAHELLRAPLEANLSKTAVDEDSVSHFRVLQDGMELRPEDLPMQQAARGVVIRNFEEEVVFDDGSLRHLFGNAIPLHDPEGKVRGAIGAFVDITQRKQAEEALREADRRKNEFLAMLAHEMRNPLAPLRNALQVIRQLGPQDQRLQQMYGMMDRQTEQLNRMVDDLLDVSRISQGKVVLRKEIVDLAAVLTRAVETSRPLIDAGSHRLTVALPPGKLYIQGDLPRLVQVFSNLLNNAAKYTEPGGNIALTVEVRGAEVQIRVQDNGIGIPAEILPRIFDLYTQADRTLHRAQGGLGIGLTLVKNLVELHGGTVQAFSAGPERGSEFVVTLPLVPKAAG